MNTLRLVRTLVPRYMAEKGGTRAKELFAEIDKDRSGRIDGVEFAAALDKMNLSGLSQEVRVCSVVHTAGPMNGASALCMQERGTLRESAWQWPDSDAAALGASILLLL